jgi:hypothetical protein
MFNSNRIRNNTSARTSASIVSTASEPWALFLLVANFVLVESYQAYRDQQSIGIMIISSELELVLVTLNVVLNRTIMELVWIIDNLHICKPWN